MNSVIVTAFCNCGYASLLQPQTAASLLKDWHHRLEVYYTQVKASEVGIFLQQNGELDINLTFYST